MTEAEKTGQHVANELRAEIASGDLAEGSRFPSISEIQNRFKVKKSAAEHAVRILRGEGLIVTRPGAPTIVKKFERIPRDSNRLKRSQWGAGRAIQAHDTGDRWHDLLAQVGEGPAPDFAADLLGVAPGSTVVVRSRAYDVDGRRVQLATSYIPVELARGTAIVYSDTGPGGIYGRLDERGFGPVRFTEDVIVRAATPEEADRLNLASGGARVFEITRAAYAADGRCVEVNRMVLDVDAYRLVHHFTA